MLFRQLKLEHIQYITPHSVQTEEYKWLLTPGLGSVLLDGVAVSAWADGRCVAAAGIVPQHKGRGEAWMLLSAFAGQYAVPIVRHTRAVLDRSEHKRVECTTQVNDLGFRFATLLGFTLEATLEAAGVNGEDMYLWKRIKH
jgi:hypothetical protein